MCSSTCLRIEPSVFPRIEIRDRCSTRVAAMQSIISADENGVCRVVMGQTLGRWKALRRGKTKMAQIVASTNERPQSAKKYEQRYLFPRASAGHGRARRADHLPKLAPSSFNRNRVHIVAHRRTNYK